MPHSTSSNAPRPSSNIAVALLTGNRDRHYAFGLGTSLVSNGVCLEVIGSDEVDSPEMHNIPNLTFLNLRGNQSHVASISGKAWRVFAYYARLIQYTLTAKPKVFHILWNNKVQVFDRTLLMLYYKLCGKRIVFTAHNVNAGERDLNDSFVNRLTLKSQYKLCDHIFVHTPRMKAQLIKQFGVTEQAITVIPYGINNAVPDTQLTPAEARRRLGLKEGERAILFFGAIRPYKGLEYLVDAYRQLLESQDDYRLIIAGEAKKEAEGYVRHVLHKIACSIRPDRVITHVEYIPDEEAEIYFKAADVLVLPYANIFQSGVLFFAYSFGLPVIASDVGSLRDDIVEGKTGFLCKPCDPLDLATVIQCYFKSDLFRGLDSHRREIRDYFASQHSWGAVGKITSEVYGQLSAQRFWPRVFRVRGDGEGATAHRRA